MTTGWRNKTEDALTHQIYVNQARSDFSTAAITAIWVRRFITMPYQTRPLSAKKLSLSRLQHVTVPSGRKVGKRARPSLKTFVTHACSELFHWHTFYYYKTYHTDYWFVLFELQTIWLVYETMKNEYMIGMKDNFTSAMTPIYFPRLR